MSAMSGVQLEELIKAAMDVRVNAHELQNSVARLRSCFERSEDPRLMDLGHNLVAAVYPDVVEASYRDDGALVVKKFLTGNGALFSGLLDQIIKARSPDPDSKPRRQKIRKK